LITVLPALVLLSCQPRLLAQESEIVRPPTPPLEDFETDANSDGIPDGWYNLRDARLMTEGGVVGPRFLRFENKRPGRPARLSRAFGVDGRKSEAVIIGLWVRLEQIQMGERLGDDPGLVIDFLGDQLRTTTRGSLGPWNKLNNGPWTRVAKRIAVPPGTRDAIISVGLLGATGVMDIDGMTIDLVPVGGAETTNLVVNGDFELGDPDPAGWLIEPGVQRVSFPARSGSALELAKAGTRATTGLAVPVQNLAAIELSLMVKAQKLRGSGGALAGVFFLEAEGRPLVAIGPAQQQVRTWGGTFDWRSDRVVIPVPPTAQRAVIQFEKHDGNGVLLIDEVKVVAAPNPEIATWTPYHVEDDTTGWLPVGPSPRIAAGSALDASYLLDAPAGKHGFVTVRDRRLAFSKGGRARFFGVNLLAPVPFLDRDRADALVDRLARSGINLVRLGDLDTPLGPQRSLYEDSRDDTSELDPVALGKLDHLIATLKARGIYIALELQSARRYRSEDGVADVDRLPLGGGPGAFFDPNLRERQLESAKKLLAHVNPETGLALRDDPVLAWVTLAGETSMFDQIDNSSALPPTLAAELKTLAQKSVYVGRRFWQHLEGEHLKDFAAKLREDHLQVPIAGVSHWRREPEFAAAQATPGLDLIDDRLFWTPQLWGDPERFTFLFSRGGALAAGAAGKRKADRPYVVGQWCHQTVGAWAYRYEAADVLLASLLAAHEDWDALVRRGIFVYPTVWGTNSAGTGGGEDIYQIPEVVNGIPQVFSLWPHAASLMLQGKTTNPAAPAHRGPAAAASARKSLVPGWYADQGRLVVDTPYTQGLAGWPGIEPAVFDHLAIKIDQPYAVVVASSLDRQPISSATRLLVTAVARVEPTGYRWVDNWKRDVADPGRPPLLQEPVQARIRWRRKGSVRAFALDNTGARAHPVPLETTEEGVALNILGTEPTLHWELVIE
jgi:hypothetical protein